MDEVDGAIVVSCVAVSDDDLDGDLEAVGAPYTTIEQLPHLAVRAEFNEQQEQELRDEALRTAEAEGLVLENSHGRVPGKRPTTGFVGVMPMATNRSGHKFYAVRRHQVLGRFVTAEEAALAYARDLTRDPPLQKKRAYLPRMTAEEALRAAADEGLHLVRSPGSKSGFKNVSGNGKPGDKFRWAAVRRIDGRTEKLGSYYSAEEAALEYARAIGPEMSKEEAAQADAAMTSAAIVSLPSTPGVPQRYNPSLRHLPACTPFTVEEVLRHAAAEGLSLYRSESTASGYVGVQKDKRGDCKHRPFMAYLAKPKHRALGSFATAEEAALCYARARSADPGAK